MPPLAIMAATTLASTGAQALANSAAGSDEEKALAAKQAALDNILKISLPDLQAQKLALAQQGVVGNLDPTMEGIVTHGPSAMEGISTDPRLKEAQMKALETLQGLGNTGLSSMDRVALMEIRNKNAGDAKAGQEAIMQNMAARGMGGGGQELASRLIANQASANRGSMEGMQVAAQAQQKALEALIGGGSLGGQIRSQEFGEQSDVARAKDAIEQFNAANRQGVLSRNTANQNEAQQFNLSNAQSVANRNVDLKNAEQQYNKELYQKQFENELNKGKAAAGQSDSVAQQYQQQAAGTRQMGAGIASGIGSIGGAFAANAATPSPTKNLLTNNAPDEGVIGPPDPRKAKPLTNWR
jgi:hypothetical protein